MSLDTVVYTNFCHINLDINLNAFEIDEETGEIFTDDSFVSKQYPRETFISIEIRLGNIDKISKIRQEISQIIITPFEESIILNKILYSSFHSGDKIEVYQLSKLSKEINYIEQKIKKYRTESIDIFLRNMHKLIQAAKQENNPIVFI